MVGKVFQAQGRKEQSQKNKSLPSPWSLSTGGQPGQFDVYSGCVGDMQVKGLADVELSRAMSIPAVFSFLLKVMGNYGRL